jgi:hypothetical protein
MLQRFPNSSITFNALYKRPDFESFLAANQEFKEKLSKTFMELTELNDDFISIIKRNRNQSRLTK